VASILIVDDDPSVARLVDLTMAVEGHETEILDRGRATLDRLEGPPVDLVVLDVMLPEMDGFELLGVLRGRREWAATKVIMMTALDSDADVWRGWSGGADYYLTKPFDISQLRTVAMRLLAGDDLDAVPATDPS
jgi:two-component system, OmpR family, alkaline phosphatase synthesis response regulator PhoP